MANDLISRKALIADLRTAKGLGKIIAETIVRFVEKQPTVDAVEVVHGRWINPYMNRYGHPCHCCSVCGFKASYQDKNYCPNCGADMRERKNEERNEERNSVD